MQSYNFMNMKKTAYAISLVTSVGTLSQLTTSKRLGNLTKTATGTNALFVKPPKQRHLIVMTIPVILSVILAVMFVQ